MKTGNVLKIGSRMLGGCLALGLGLTPTLATADGTEILLPPGIAIQSGSETTAAAASLEPGLLSGILNVNVPANATIKQVLLYWEGRRLDTASGVDENKVLVEGDFGAVVLTGTLIGGPSAEFDPIAATNARPRSFRAALSDLSVLVPGPITLKVTRQNPSTMATSIIVVYDQPSASYGGRAIGVVSKVLTNFTRVVDTGALPPTGGFLEPAPVLNIKGVPGLIGSKTVSASVIGAGGGTLSKAAIDGTKINALGSLISADVINSTALAECRADGTARVVGTSDFVDLRITGLLKLPIKFKPNTTLLNLLGLVKVVANQQIVTGGPNAKSITVNGLRVTTPLTNKLLGKLLGKVPGNSVADITLASSTAAISCSILAGPALTLVDGADFAFRDFNFTPNLGTTAERTVNFPAAAVDRTARLALFVADAEASRPDTIVVKVNGVIVATVFNTLDGSNGGNADLESAFVPIPAGATSVSVQILSEANATPIGGNLPDSLVWVWAALSLPSGVPGANLYSGQATVANIGVLGVINAVVGDTGPVPSIGGELDATVNVLPLLPLLGSITGQAQVKAGGEVSEANASVEKLGLSILGINILADVLSTTARAECKPDNTVALSGTSTIANLLIGGSPILLNGQLTLNIPFLNGKVLINERIMSSGPNSGSITVNAIHIVVGNILPIGGDDLVNVAIASSHADILCN